MLLTELTMKTFTGHAIKPYLHCLARLSAEIFKEYPFLCDLLPEAEIELLKKYPCSEEAIAVLLFEGSEVVGAATGIPLVEDLDLLQKPFKQKGLDPQRFYHFGEALLLKPYRGRGVGHHFYQIREEHARKLNKYDYACLYFRDRHEDDPLKPLDYYPLDDFWRKRGFIHHKDLKVKQRWKVLGEDIDSDNECSFWVKKL